MRNKFKKGEKVVRIRGSHQGMDVGDIATVSDQILNTVYLKEFDYGHMAGHFELYVPVRAHHDIIIQWAKGAEIQYYHTYHQRWTDCKNPTFKENCKYRVRPTAHTITIDGKDIMLSEESFEALRGQLV